MNILEKIENVLNESKQVEKRIKSLWDKINSLPQDKEESETILSDIVRDAEKILKTEYGLTEHEEEEIRAIIISAYSKLL